MKPLVKTEDYRIKPDENVSLKNFDPHDNGGIDKEEGEKAFAKLYERMTELQELLYADAKHSLLIVLQAMDAAGKDSVTSEVFGAFNPLGCHAFNFKAPTETERRHDFLWRIHPLAPETGHITIFNRSHYEDVLVVRVKNLVEEKKWRERYDVINAFEKSLSESGTVVLKFYLHISKEYQKERMERRLGKPTKHWKFNPGDLADRAKWPEFMKAYEDAMEKCSKKHAPWYVIPAERHWFRNLLIAQVVVEKLESLNMKYPKADYDAASIVIPE